MTTPPINSTTEGLHPIITELLNTKFNDHYQIPSAIPAFRQMMNEFTRIVSFSEVEEISIHELTFVPDGLPDFKIRIYNANRMELNPVLVYFHGGNWIAGGLQTSDAVCQTLAEGSNYVVISVDYALAPEHHFPTPLYQGLEVIEWIRRQGVHYGIDRHKIVVGGDNAGGNIAAGLVHLLNRERANKLFGQLLICPALNHHFDTSSYAEFANGYLQSRDLVQASWIAYLGVTNNGSDELASPLLASNISHVPPTLIFSAGYDPLRDEAEEYASRLKNANIPVHLHRFKSVTHHFWLMDGILDVARKAQREAVRFLIKLNNPAD
jgi:acetyl esterase